MDAAVQAAVLTDLAGVFVLAPYELPTADWAPVVGAAERDDDSGDDVAAALVDALGAGVLARLLVAYVGCFTDSRRPEALAREIGAVARRAGLVVVVEPEAPKGSASRVGALLAAENISVREHRLVPPDGGSGSPVLRRFVCGTATPGPRPAPLRVAISDHMGKSLAIAHALAAAGHELVDFADTADIVLIDHDAPFHGKLRLVEACVRNGGRAFLYPHGADPAMMSSWDGLYPICPLLSGALVIAEGHAEIARRWGYPFPTHTIGWSLCEQRPRQTACEPRRVLFAPTHPPYLGNPRYPGRNAEIFGRLLQCPVEITVRHIGPIEENGLWDAAGVTFVRGDAPGSPGMIEQIDAFDAVVADRSTFGNLAIARGVAAVLWDSAIVLNNDGSSSPDHVHLYREYLRYPFDADSGGLWQVLQAAAADTQLVAEWRAKFIGEPLDVAALEQALRAG